MVLQCLGLQFHDQYRTRQALGSRIGHNPSEGNRMNSAQSDDSINGRFLDCGGALGLFWSLR